MAINRGLNLIKSELKKRHKSSMSKVEKQSGPKKPIQRKSLNKSERFTNGKSQISETSTLYHKSIVSASGTVISSSSFEKEIECPLKKTILDAKSMHANSSYQATKIEVDEKLKKRTREIFEKTRSEKEKEEREESEKRANLQRLIRERKAHLALIEKVEAQVVHPNEYFQYFLELEKQCGNKSCTYEEKNFDWYIKSSYYLGSY
ncbi:uncharacterized protein LOC115697597 isoform X2 [Cannabis sativa]|uniref:uncharacterized protein LOC115697597 isoform X2 n=1 Tax=Cannabis sativa TaxID=3483 RepID=UPI0029CA09BB|nr:uncharacterized protein LOC115697597 isoform X2 [Cannabis sativa]